MRHNAMLLPLALLGATSASAATFVLDDFDTPTPVVAIDSPTGTVVANLDGPYGRALVANAFVEGNVSYRAGGGTFIRRPNIGATGETILAYLVYGFGGPGPLDLSGYHYLQFKFDDVTGGTPLNLNAEFFTSAATVDKPLYYGLVSTNWNYSPQQRSVYLPLDAVASKFRFDYVQGIGFFFDRAGFGVDGFTLDRIALTTGVPEPASWGLMLGGFGLVGAIARRRRVHAPIIA